jgi:hypothetical protein
MPENQADITLGVLNAVEENQHVTQRLVANDLGVALGLINSYLKRCIKKGFVKISHPPANRYSYYLPPGGFAEKCRLTAEYLSGSLTFFRTARQQCDDILSQCTADGHQNVVLVGGGDLAEIVIHCAHKFDIKLNGVVEADGQVSGTFGLQRFARFEDVDSDNAFVITNLLRPQEVYSEISKIHDDQIIYIPGILCVSRSTLNFYRRAAK